MNRSIPTERRRLRGYSLTELLVVIAIIGLISLVAVPGFMSMYRSSKMKSAVTAFTGRVRAARQLGVTSNCRSKLRFDVGGTQYEVWQEKTDPTTGTATWTQVSGEYTLEDTGSSGTPAAITFKTSGFDEDPSGSGWNSAIFNADGTLVTPGSKNPSLQIQTTDSIPKPLWEVDISNTGSVSTKTLP